MLPIAAGGDHRPPVVVTHITDREGNEVARFAPDAKVVLDDEVAVELLDMMRGVVDYGTGTEIRSAFGARGDLAGKTGTTQDGADGWFLLMHPDLVTGAWVGFDDPRVTFRSSYWGQGGHNALRLVGDFTRTVQRAGLVDTRKAFPRPPERRERGPGLWDRFSDWVGGLLDSEGDVPEDYGPRTPGRLGDREAPDEVWAEAPRRRGFDDEPVIDPDWVEEQWLDLERIEDPIVREAARFALRRALREVNRNAGGWRDEILDARDRAIDRAEREVEAARREADRRGLFADEYVPEEDPFDVEIEEAPVEAAPAPEVDPIPPMPIPDPTPPGRERVPETEGQIGW